jgi:hypothetical protein
MCWAKYSSGSRFTENVRVSAPQMAHLWVAVLLLAISTARAQDVPTPVMCTAQCPDGSWTQVHCSGGDAEYFAGCHINPNSNGGAPNNASSVNSVAAPLTGAALRRQMNQQLVMGVTNAAMQGAINGFLSSLARNNAAAQQQQQAFQQEMLRRQQEAAEQQRLAEQQRIDAMFARLNSELKLEGVPFGLSLKGMNSTGPEGLQLKGLNSSGPGDLKLKIGDASPTSYGLKGLPGIYVGDPGGGDGGSSGTSATVNSNDAAAASNPNLASGPGSGTTGPGIAGLPGIYLDGVQPSQAPQLAQAAANLSGPEKDVAEDTALQAAQQNPALAAPSQDPQVNNFQQADQQYQKALQADTTATQEYNAAQERVTADQSALQTAQSQLGNLQPTVDQQAALQKMLDVAGSDEEAAGIARKMFDNANLNLSVARGNAAGALAAMAPPSNVHAGTSVVGLNPNAVAANLKTPEKIGAPVLLPAPKPASYASPTKSIPTQQQLRNRLEGIQEALRRLAEDEKKRGEARKEAAHDVEEAVGDAEERGVSMLFDLLTTGWDNCAPVAQGGVVGKLERDAARIPGRIEEVYKDASAAKTGSDLGAFNNKVEELEKTKQWLENSANQIEHYNHRIAQLEATDNTKEIIEKSDGAWLSTLEGVHKTIEMGLDDKPITDYLEKAAGMADCHVVALKALSSAVESAEDIFKEGNAAEELRQMDDNTMKFLDAQKLLDQKLKATTAQLNCYKLQDPANVVNCAQKAGQP